MVTRKTLGKIKLLAMGYAFGSIIAGWCWVCTTNSDYSIYAILQSCAALGVVITVNQIQLRKKKEEGII